MTLAEFRDQLMNKRKVIQLSTVIDCVGKYLVLAVCNDGTIWKLDGLYEGNPSWEPFPVPPQKDEATVPR